MVEYVMNSKNVLQTTEKQAIFLFIFAFSFFFFFPNYVFRHLNPRAGEIALTE